MDCFKFLVQTALAFLFWHELGHVRESGGRTAPDIASARREELVADHWGALASINELLNRTDSANVAGHRFRLWGFGITVLFGLCEAFIAYDRERDAIYASPFGETYLSGRVRTYWVCEALAVRDADWQGDMKRSVVDLIGQGREEARAAWAKIGWGALDDPTPEELEEVATVFESSEM